MKTNSLYVDKLIRDIAKAHPTAEQAKKALIAFSKAIGDYSESLKRGFDRIPADLFRKEK